MLKGPSRIRRGHFVPAFLMLLILFHMNSAMAENGRPSEELPRLVSTALANNPELKASDARWHMFKEKIEQARSLDDPMLTLAIRNGVFTDPLNFGKEPMTGKVIELSQKLPFWGKRELRGEIAAKTAESYQWTVAERKVELERMVKEAWYRLYYIDKSIGIVDKNTKILDDFVTIAETRYSVNRGTQTDIFKAQVERSKLMDMRLSLEQQRKSEQANLNTLLYRPAETPVGRYRTSKSSRSSSPEKSCARAHMKTGPR